MRVKLSKAVKMFFGNSSLKMVYFEAIANALDAGATKINIAISAQDYSQPETLTISIEDNGVGFTDDRFSKFSKLFDVNDNNHKGLGRLVYLCYFEKALITSNYNEFYHRTFEFSDAFDEKSEVVKNDTSSINGTKIFMSGYILTKLAQHNFIQPNFLKSIILEQFYSRLYKLKQSGVITEITISTTVDKVNATETLCTTEIPDFSPVKVEHSLDFFSKVELYYNIEEVPMAVSNVITAISVDGRTYPLDIIAQENLPVGYKMVFLLFSDYFDGKVDASRETPSIPELEQIKTIFRNNIAKIIDEKLPQITEQNRDRKKRLVNLFPHLNGYFDVDSIGYTSQEDLLKKAQERFFRVQRKILGATTLTEELFQESLELASRTLTEYILLRQNTINKLKTIDKKDNEAVIHDLIIPMREQFDEENWNNDLYRNNVWVLDDKYMTYDTILSDKEMTDVVRVITEGEVVDKDSGRPDIAMIFSGNPNGTEDKKVDVVIVELKKKGLSAELNSIVESQLKERARKLLKYYNSKIQQIWFYGIVEIDEDYEYHLSDENYNKLYSNGKLYYKATEVTIQLNPTIKVPIGLFIMDFDAVVNDADARNSTFLNIIKSKFKI